MEFLCWAMLTTSLAADPAEPRGDLDALLRRISTETVATRKAAEAVNPDDGSRDVGIDGSVNFTVLAPPGNSLARRVLVQAEHYRREVALTWLGEELPAGVELTHINVRLDATKDEGLTLLAGPGRSLPGANRMWLTTSLERALSTTLEHEVTHVVLAARFGATMPIWANEGIASLADDPRRGERRRAILAGLARAGSLPALKDVLEMKQMAPTDERSYAVAVSLTEFLLDRDDRPTLVAFIDDGRQNGWPRALERHYKIGGLPELQREWERWVAGRVQ